jgi:hypothetical protein
VCDARVYCMDMATKLSLRRLWTIYKQILNDSTGNNRRDIILAQRAFYAGARRVLRVLDYMLEHGEQDTALRTIRRLGKARPLEQGGRIKGIQVKRSKRRLQ